MNAPYDAAGELTNLARWIDDRLDDERADRQYIAEQALARIQAIVASLSPSPAAGELEFGLRVTDPMDVRLDNLRRMAVDAVAYRNTRVAEPCAECAAQGRPCLVHEGHRDMASLYEGLAVELGAGPVTTYPIQAWRWEGGWELRIAGLGVTQSATLDDAPAMVADFIALQLGIPADSLAVDIRAAGEGAEGCAVAAEAIEADAEDLADAAAADAAMAEPGEPIPLEDLRAEFGDEAGQ